MLAEYFLWGCFIFTQQAEDNYQYMGSYISVSVLWICYHMHELYKF